MSHVCIQISQNTSNYAVDFRITKQINKNGVNVIYFKNKVLLL